MTEKYSFFGSTEEDIRQYDQTDYAGVYKRFIKTGVFPSIENELAVAQTVPARLAVQVNTGEAFIEGYWYGNSSIKEIDLPAADAVNPRIDRIVLRLDVVNQRKITAEYLQGVAAVAPVAPDLTRTDQIYEISLAQVYVAAGATSILNANITDERSNLGVCGWAIPYVTPEQIGAIDHVVKDISNTDLNSLNKTDFYLGSNLDNAPNNLSFFIFHLECDFGKRQYAYKISTNEVYTRIYASNTWSAWDQVAQKSNVPSFLNIDANNDASISGEGSYPAGVTLQSVGNAVGFPHTHGMTVNLKQGTARFTQLFFRPGATAPDMGMWFRHYYTGAGWSQFFKVMTNDPEAHVEANLSSVSVSNGVAKILTGFTEAEDVKSNFNPSTGQFTVPTTGTYSFNIEFTHTMSVPHTGGISLERNGSNTTYKPFASTGNSSFVVRSKTFYLTAGDVIRLLRTGNATGNIDGINLTISKI
jgi:C1q domain